LSLDGYALRFGSGLLHCVNTLSNGMLIAASLNGGHLLSDF
jgi:hypothetical protein